VKRRSPSRSRSRKKKAAEERPKTIEEIRRERKLREAENAPENKLKQLQMKVAQDAVALLKEKEEAKQKAAEEEAEKAKAAAAAERKKQQQPLLDGIKEAVAEVRKAAATGDAEAIKTAQPLLAMAVQAAKGAGISEEDILEASTAPPAPEPEKKDEAEAEKANEEPDEEALEKQRKKKEAKAAKKKQQHQIKVAIYNAIVAAKTEGLPTPQIAKAGAAAAKEAGGSPADISDAAKLALKVASGEEVPPPAEEESDSSSSSSSDSSETEEEAPLAEGERAKAKREGIAAAFYFGIK